MQSARVVLRTASVGARSLSTEAAALSPLRTWGAVGKRLRDAPDTVRESQKYFAHKPNHTYIARDSDKMVVNGAYVLTGLAAVYAVGGVFNAITGKGKKA